MMLGHHMSRERTMYMDDSRKRAKRKNPLLPAITIGKPHLTNAPTSQGAYTKLPCIQLDDQDELDRRREINNRSFEQLKVDYRNRALDQLKQINRDIGLRHLLFGAPDLDHYRSLPPIRKTSRRGSHVSEEDADANDAADISAKMEPVNYKLPSIQTDDDDETGGGGGDRGTTGEGTGRRQSKTSEHEESEDDVPPSFIQTMMAGLPMPGSRLKLDSSRSRRGSRIEPAIMEETETDEHNSNAKEHIITEPQNGKTPKLLHLTKQLMGDADDSDPMSQARELWRRASMVEQRFAGASKEANVRKSSTTSTIAEELVTCRYLRGREPEWMENVDDINDFIFGSK